MLKLLKFNFIEPSINRTLVNEFYSLKRVHDDVVYGFLIDEVIADTKNCHGLTPLDILNKIDFAMRKKILDEPNLSLIEIEALNNVLEVLSIHRQKMLF